MSNPRKFGDSILYRATKKMPLNKAKKKAAAIRSTGIRARVDTFEGAYAVWSTKKSKSPKKQSLESIPKGRLGINVSASKYFSSLLPSGMTANNIGKNIDTGYYDISITGNIFLSVYESSTHLESLVLYIPKELQGKGIGTSIVMALKKYVDSKGIGLAVRDVDNVKFVKKFKWLKSTRSPHIQYNPTFGYKVTTKQLYDIPITAEEVKERAQKKVAVKKPSQKMITIYRGGQCSALPRIRKSGKVIGWWTLDYDDALGYTESFTEDCPIVLVAKVPKSSIMLSKRWIEAHEDIKRVEGFKWKGGHIKRKKGVAIKEDPITAVLPVKYITHYYYWEPTNRGPWTRKRGKL